MNTKTVLTDAEIIAIGEQSHAMEPGENGDIPPVAQKGDMRLKDGKLWVCSDPDINRWVCPDDRGWQLVPKELTNEMRGKFWEADEKYQDGLATMPDAGYKTMLEAAPKFGEEE